MALQDDLSELMGRRNRSVQPIPSSPRSGQDRSYGETSGLHRQRSSCQIEGFAKREKTLRWEIIELRNEIEDDERTRRRALDHAEHVLLSAQSTMKGLARELRGEQAKRVRAVAEERKEAQCVDEARDALRSENQEMRRRCAEYDRERYRWAEELSASRCRNKALETEVKYATESAACRGTDIARANRRDATDVTLALFRAELQQARRAFESSLRGVHDERLNASPRDCEYLPHGFTTRPDSLRLLQYPPGLTIESTRTTESMSSSDRSSHVPSTNSMSPLPVTSRSSTFASIAMTSRESPPETITPVVRETYLSDTRATSPAFSTGTATSAAYSDDADSDGPSVAFSFPGAEDGEYAATAHSE